MYLSNFILSPNSYQPAEDCVGVDYRTMDYQTEYSLSCQIVKVMVIGPAKLDYFQTIGYWIKTPTIGYWIKTPTIGYWIKTPTIGYWIKTPTMGYWIKTPTIGYWTFKKTYIYVE